MLVFKEGSYDHFQPNSLVLNIIYLGSLLEFTGSRPDFFRHFEGHVPYFSAPFEGNSPTGGECSLLLWPHVLQHSSLIVHMESCG